LQAWFTSDQHFGHGGARGPFGRPFATTGEMDEAMIAAWNERVGADDLVWQLGDFALYRDISRTVETLARLNGRKHLIAGNNDTDEVRRLAGWRHVADYVECRLDGIALVLCHYPLRAWNGQHRGAWQLHGHSHGRLAPLARQSDVGVDSWDFRPVSLQEILAARRRRQPRQPHLRR